ncbi:MAG TPA: (Fe-S)-binding protein [Nitrospirota bacterium]|nr:(Fe-S)-binding protein [Nitrospirota bacterium]
MNVHVEEWQQQIVKCIRCGTCRSVCPVFQVSDNENSTARGKVKLIESVTEGKLELTRELQKRMSKCLLCKACVVGCPSGVKTDVLFMSARRALAEKNGIPIIKRLAFTGLTYRKVFSLGLRLGALFQNFVFKNSPDGNGKRPRIPLPAAGLNERRLIPPLAKEPLRSRVPQISRAANRRARVAFFPGCMLNYIYPDAGVAIVDILLANDVEVILPEDLFCCGIAAAASGDFRVAQFLAERNVNTLTADSFDAVITGCASCGATLKHEYGLIIDDPSVKQRWQKMSEKVYDIAQYLTTFGYSRQFGEIQAKITYHDPCHLVRGMGVSKEPRQVLNAIPGVELAEMKDANKCCGCGGTFSLTHYDIAREINDEKLDNAERTGAEILLTGCSGCRMHISDGLSQRNSKMRVMHTAEFIAQAYKAKRGKEGKK